MTLSIKHFLYSSLYPSLVPWSFPPPPRGGGGPGTRLLVSVVLLLESTLTTYPPPDLCLYWKCTSQEDRVGCTWLTQKSEVECCSITCQTNQNGNIQISEGQCSCHVTLAVCNHTRPCSDTLYTEFRTKPAGFV